jgi:PhnB protein
MAIQPIPDGYHTATPYLIVKGAGRAIEFYKRAFGASEVMRMDGPNGRIGHAEIRIGNSPIMLADEYPEMGFRSPQSLSEAGANMKPPVSILLYVEDVDARFKKAIGAGAQELKPLQDQFYGDRSGTLQDPFGHVWTIATHKEDVSPDEMKKRAEAFLKAAVRVVTTSATRYIETVASVGRIGLAGAHYLGRGRTRSREYRSERAFCALHSGTASLIVLQ